MLGDGDFETPLLGLKAVTIVRGDNEVTILSPWKGSVCNTGTVLMVLYSPNTWNALLEDLGSVRNVFPKLVCKRFDHCQSVV